MLRSYPGEVIITDGADAEGSATPAGEPDDDFFSSWDKPAIKRPTPPISRTGTPAGRTPSPFLNANNGKDIARSASPLSKTESTEEKKPAPSRITSSAALRKTGAAGGPRKANVLGAKKVNKLGVKKAADLIDFDEAEKKAKEEADRIEKLGYDPNAEDEESKESASAASIMSPTPVASTPSASTSSHTRQKSNAEVERLGMGVTRLGFGQVGGSKAAASAQAPKRNAGGFGSVGPVRASDGTFSSQPLLCMVK